MYKTHGHTTHTGASPTYKSWHMMKQRCTNPMYSQYKDYGGRRIAFDPAWSDFSAFLKDMGPRPSNTSLERKDNAGNYTKHNCYWATKTEQQRNRRTNRVIELDGRAQLLTEWAAELDLTPQALIGRLRSWPLEQALTTPAMQRGRRKGAPE